MKVKYKTHIGHNNEASLIPLRILVEIFPLYLSYSIPVMIFFFFPIPSDNRSNIFYRPSITAGVPFSPSLWPSTPWNSGHYITIASYHPLPPLSPLSLSLLRNLPSPNVIPSIYRLSVSLILCYNWLRLSRGLAAQSLARLPQNTDSFKIFSLALLGSFCSPLQQFPVLTDTSVVPILFHVNLRVIKCYTEDIEGQNDDFWVGEWCGSVGHYIKHWYRRTKWLKSCHSLHAKKLSFGWRSIQSFYQFSPGFLFFKKKKKWFRGTQTYDELKIITKI